MKKLEKRESVIVSCFLAIISFHWFFREPLKSFSRSCFPTLQPSKFIEDTSEISELIGGATDMNKAINEESQTALLSARYVLIAFLSFTIISILAYLFKKCVHCYSSLDFIYIYTVIDYRYHSLPCILEETAPHSWILNFQGMNNFLPAIPLSRVPRIERRLKIISSLWIDDSKYRHVVSNLLEFTSQNRLYWYIDICCDCTRRLSVSSTLLVLLPHWSLHYRTVIGSGATNVSHRLYKRWPTSDRMAVLPTWTATSYRMAVCRVSKCIDGWSTPYKVVQKQYHHTQFR